MKRILFVQSRPPHGTLAGQEGLDALLMASAFGDCSLLFLDDGIFQVMSGQMVESLGVRNYAVTFGALEDYGVRQVYCSASDLTRRGLTPDDLVISVTPVDDEAIRQLMADHDVIMSF